MRLAVDIREACGPKRTGKGQWTHAFVSELVRRNIPLVLLSDRDIPAEWKRDHVSVQMFPPGMGWHLRASKFLKQSKDIDAYVSTTSYLVPALVGKKFPTITIIHDLIAFRDEPHDRKAQWIERLTLPRVVRSTRHLCAISEATKHDLLARFSALTPDRVTTIYAGPMLEHPKASHPDGKTILCAATLCPRKNQLRLIQAYATLPQHLRDAYHLTLVGSRGWHDEEILALAKKTHGVEWKSYVSDDDYQTLLSTCAVLALPSLYEGFGMQILDALQRGTPVLTSSRGSLAEVAGDAACIVDPEDVASIAAGLQHILTDEAYRRELAQKGPVQAAQFSWKRTVDLFLEAVHQVH